MTLGELDGISSGLRSELGKMNLYFKEAKRLCSNSQHIISGDICKKFVSETEDAFAHNKPKKVGGVFYNCIIVYEVVDAIFYNNFKHVQL